MLQGATVGYSLRKACTDTKQSDFLGMALLPLSLEKHLYVDQPCLLHITAKQSGKVQTYNPSTWEGGSGQKSAWDE